MNQTRAKGELAPPPTANGALTGRMRPGARETANGMAFLAKHSWKARESKKNKIHVSSSRLGGQTEAFQVAMERRTAQAHKDSDDPPSPPMPCTHTFFGTCSSPLLSNNVHPRRRREAGSREAPWQIRHTGYPSLPCSTTYDQQSLAPEGFIPAPHLTLKAHGCSRQEPAGGDP